MLGEAYSWIAVAVMVAVCLLILLTVIIAGKDQISWRFLTTIPSASAADMGSGGISTPLIGTVLLTLIGIIIAIPLSLATSVYTSFYRTSGAAARGIGLAIDILSGVPTIVIALFALAIFTNPQLVFLSTPVQNGGGAIIERAYGRSFLVAGITMAIMILPAVVKSMTEALRAVPRSYIDGAMALGADKWRMVTKIAVPAASRGIVTGIVLGMGRIMGDTAIVWLALGGTLRMTGQQPWYFNMADTLRNTGSTLTSYIYYASPAGEGQNNDVAFAASLVLIVIILILNAITALLGGLGSSRR
jgi:phosphate transport system permease protein